MLRRLPPLRPGDAVVDLGCAPGAWAQVLAQHVGPDGCVVAADLEPVEALGPPVELLRLDVAGSEAPARIEAALGRRAALVLSDAAPKLSGIADLDRAAIEELWQGALRVADRVLAPGGSLVIKGFPGAESVRFRAELKKRFARVTELRPEGKRQTSREFYWVCEHAPAKRGRRRTRRGTRPSTRGSELR